MVTSADESFRLPTISDVARLAGVSKTTASDALQGRGRVSAATRERVSTAARTLGYRLHAGARDLTRRRSEVLGLLVGDFFDPFVSELTAHLEHEASSHGFRVLLATAGLDLQDEQRALSNLVEHRVASVILVAYGDNDESLRSVAGHTPVVSLASSGPGTSIGVNDLAGALLAMDHLIELGHRRIGYLTGPLLPAQVDRARLSGYRAALQRAALPAPPRYRCTIGPHGSRDRLAPLQEMLTSSERPTAVFATSDVLALDLMACAIELGLQVPQDLSIVGFDDIQIASFPTIGLTTVAQPAAELARMAVEAAIQQLSGQGQPGSALLDPRLVVRTSTAAASSGTDD
jgi:LacI family transcriptional regulator